MSTPRDHVCRVLPSQGEHPAYVLVRRPSNGVGLPPIISGGPLRDLARRPIPCRHRSHIHLRAHRCLQLVRTSSPIRHKALGQRHNPRAPPLVMHVRYLRAKGALCGSFGTRLPLGSLRMRARVAACGSFGTHALTWSIGLRLFRPHPPQSPRSAPQSSETPSCDEGRVMQRAATNAQPMKGRADSSGHMVQVIRRNQRGSGAGVQEQDVTAGRQGATPGHRHWSWEARSQVGAAGRPPRPRSSWSPARRSTPNPRPGHRPVRRSCGPASAQQPG